MRTMEGGRIEMNLGRQVDGERYTHRDETLVIMVISTNCLVTIIVVNVCSDLHKALQSFVKRSNKASSWLPRHRHFVNTFIIKCIYELLVFSFWRHL